MDKGRAGSGQETFQEVVAELSLEGWRRISQAQGKDEFLAERAVLRYKLDGSKKPPGIGFRALLAWSCLLLSDSC